MSGTQITVGFDGADALAALRRMGQVHTPLLRAIGVGLAATTRARFNAGRGPDGAAWRPLNPAYAAVKRGPPNILIGVHGMSGGLQGSISFRTGASSVTIGSNKIYAGVHQFGAVIRPKGKALVFRMAGGLAFAKSVTIPARPYLGFGPEDRQTVLDVTGVFLHAALQGRPLG